MFIALSQHNAPGYTRWTTVAERELPADLYPNRGFTVWEIDDPPATTPEVETKEPFDLKPKSSGRAPGDLVIKVEQSGAPPQIVVYPVCAIALSSFSFPPGTVHDILSQRRRWCGTMVLTIP